MHVADHGNGIECFLMSGSDLSSQNEEQENIRRLSEELSKAGRERGLEEARKGDGMDKDSLRMDERSK